MQAFHEKPRTLIAMDFDGTVANTFSAPSSGIGVCEAYMYAVEETFGLAALEKYVAEGGLRNRAPVEVVRQLAPDATKTEKQKFKQSSRSLMQPNYAFLWTKLARHGQNHCRAT